MMDHSNWNPSEVEWDRNIEWLKSKHKVWTPPSLPDVSTWSEGYTFYLPLKHSILLEGFVLVRVRILSD